ncbi:MAG: hypothetical protein UMR38_05715 [Candidatus Izemoplasma sp.]|nr:hypothetical protein [Candidatus Izemoplasma sp.]
MDDQYESDVEKGKIQKDKQAFNKSREKGKQLLNNYIHVDFDEDVYEEYLD